MFLEQCVFELSCKNTHKKTHTCIRAHTKTLPCTLINGHSIPCISRQYTSCSSYFHITLQRNIKIQVPRSIILVTMQTVTQIDKQAKTSFASEKLPRIFYP